MRRSGRGARRVVFCTPGLGDRGGAARRAEMLTSELANRGWQVVVVSRSSRRFAIRFTRDRGRQILEIPSLGVGRLSAPLYIGIGVLFGLPHAFQSCAVVGIQFNSPSLLAALIATFSRRRLVLVATSDGVQDVERLRMKTSRTRRHLFAHVNAVVAQSDESATTLAAAFPRADSYVLSNPVQPPRTQVKDRRASRCLYLDRFHQVKNLDVLLDAWLRIAVVSPQHRLRMVGGFVKGDQTPEIQERIAAEPTLRATVELRPWTDTPALEITNAALFVLPSTVEGMSNALLEACSHGLPVVASDIPGNRRVLGSDYPMLFDPADSYSLASCIRSVLEDSELAVELSRIVRARAAHFSPESVVSRLEAVILHDG